VLTWKGVGTCDTFEIERQDMNVAYPPTPQFMTAGSVMTYTDTTATMNPDTYFYRVRCKVGTVTSTWSTERAWAHP
jgi:hypothetical protein